MGFRGKEERDGGLTGGSVGASARSTNSGSLKIEEKKGGGIKRSNSISISDSELGKRKKVDSRREEGFIKSRWRLSLGSTGKYEKVPRIGVVFVVRVSVFVNSVCVIFGRVCVLSILVYLRVCVCVKHVLSVWVAALTVLWVFTAEVGWSSGSLSLLGSSCLCARITRRKTRFRRLRRAFIAERDVRLRAFT